MPRFPVLTTLPDDATAADKCTWHLEKAQGWDRYWRRQQFSKIPDSFTLPVARHYRELWETQGEQAANLYLRETAEQFNCLAISPKSSDDDLIGLSKQLAASCREALRLHGKTPYTAERLLRICNRYGIRPPYGLARYATTSRYGSDMDTVTGTVRRIGTVTGTVRPTNTVTHTDGNSTSMLEHALSRGTIARLTDDAWWRRKVRAVHGRILEAAAIKLHQVHRHAGCYVSNATYLRHQQQRKRNRRIIERLVAENENGDSFPLEELVEHSLANPRNRRSELMVRIYGFEQLAKEIGHEALFVTVTCPSRMHAHFGENGAPNPAYDASFTPRRAQEYLREVWARIRSKWQRLGLRPYGFRITEAHHDGTPHWHILLFIAPNELEPMTSVIRHYALAESPDEPGAAKHRFTLQAIDPTKGSATGYIAKYVSKNIDGFGLGDAGDTSDASTLAQRVAAWSSTWGIRQFQQVGGAPVGLWREFRRARDLTSSPGLVGELAQAADKGGWALFIKLLGGPQLARKELPVGLEFYDDSRQGRYGDTIGQRVAGIRHGNVVYSTRFHTWSIKPKASEKNCTQADGVRPEAFDAPPLPAPDFPLGVLSITVRSSVSSVLPS